MNKKKYCYVIDNGKYEIIIVARSDTEAWRVLKDHLGVRNTFLDYGIRKRDIIRLSGIHVLEMCGDPDRESQNISITAKNFATSFGIGVHGYL